MNNVVNLDDDDTDDRPIRWANIIFLPFHPTWKFIILLVVIMKCTVGPLSSIHNLNCYNSWLPFLSATDNITIKYFYTSLCDILYIFDTFLYVVHRQVTEEAVRKEHLPKSIVLILLDITASIPFFRLLSQNVCPPLSFWPNIMAFTEILIIYRVFQYFSLSVTHSTWKLIVGYSITLALYINILTCFLLLLTAEGLCANCRNGVHDWRSNFVLRTNNTHDHFSTHLFGGAMILSITVHKLIDETKPSTYLEYLICLTWIIVGHFLIIFVVTPKLFAEGMLRLRGPCAFHPRVTKLIEETQRRNPSPSGSQSVEQFYAFIWTKRNGITNLPNVINELPRYLIFNIRLDLVWPLFHHCHILRRTSPHYRRWLCEYIHLDYKLPGEMFYFGPNCYSKMYYIKTGVVQLISTEDNITPILSLSSGTMLGDISFLVPVKKKGILRCLTYCEMFTVSRAAILKSMHKFPEDRRMIMQNAKDRIKHAYTLNNCKSNIKGLDRADDEGISWIKKRWWELNTSLKHMRTSRRPNSLALPAEETNYHCAKFIGQLELSSNIQLHSQSIFVKVNFPWMLAKHSVFGNVWHKIVQITVFLVLIVFPPVITSNQSSKEVSIYFAYFQYVTDFIYAADVFISLITCIEEGQINVNFMSNVFRRCKQLHFILDLVSTGWPEHFTVLLDLPEYYHVVQFNRLIKTYLLFVSSYEKKWKKDSHPDRKLIFLIGLLYFWFGYVFGYLTYMIVVLSPYLSVEYFYGDSCVLREQKNLDEECKYEIDFLYILASWVFQLVFPDHQPYTLSDVLFVMFIVVLVYLLGIYTRSRFLSVLYLNNREKIQYFYLVASTKSHYVNNRIHPSLLIRLEKFLMINWKYYHGMDILYPNVPKDLPHDIYWKLQGQAAEKIIAKSAPFSGADPAFIRELAYKAKFLILPKDALLVSIGVHVKSLNWLTQGLVKNVSVDEDGKPLTSWTVPGEMLAFCTVLMRKASIGTYTAATDCEVLYIKYQDFLAVLHKYQTERECFEECFKEILPLFDNACHIQLKRNRELLKKKNLSGASEENMELSFNFVQLYWTTFLSYRQDPESVFIRNWMIFRALFVIVEIISNSLQGSSGAVIRPYLITIGFFCDAIGLIDIVIKMFLPYYTKDGKVITDVRMCILHYLVRGFLPDLIGSLPWVFIFMELLETSTQMDCVVLNSFMKFFHLYILLGLFNYISDIPTSNIVYVMIVKWQLVILLVMFGSSPYLVGTCIEFHWDKHFALVNMTRRDGCWLPRHWALDLYPTPIQFHQLCAETFSLTQCGFLLINLGKFHLVHGKYRLTFSFLMLGVLFWYQMSYCKTLLVLNNRGNTVFQYGVNQLARFLKSERVPKDIINRAVKHFIYIWKRTKGITIQTLMNERIGTVFRQDVAYFFYKETFAAVDSLLGGGEELERLLAVNTYQVHYLPYEDIVRENELAPLIYIIHRGKIVITQGEDTLAVLTKGSIFGILEGNLSRPIKISARCQGYVDLMQMTKEQFHEMITDDIRENMSDNPQSRIDFMKVKINVMENPTNSIEYILRDHYIIKMPWMAEPVAAESNVWYARWLFCVWLLGPVVTTVLVLVFYAMPQSYEAFPCLLYWVAFFDILHFIRLIAGFYTMNVVVEGHICVKKYNKVTTFLQCWFFLDVLSLIFPIISYATANMDYQLGRLLRVHSIYFFYQYICRNFETRKAALLLKLLMVVLLLHALTCGWINIACKNRKVGDVIFPEIPEIILGTLDKEEWTLPNERSDGGCLRTTKSFMVNGTVFVGFVVPKKWYGDYIVALMYIIVIHTHINLDCTVPVTILQIFYNVFLNILLYLIEVWLASICLSVVYTKVRDMYYFEYHVANLITYLRHYKLSEILLESITKYTSVLWQRQSDKWLPEITKLAPICLREDILSALYIHHLNALPLFKRLPQYFLRQLVVRLNRIVYFPGKYIVHEGDVYPCIYFIHEGEVEKLYTDNTGNQRSQSVLCVNEHFGLISGLFPDIPFKHSYFTRTVVDLIYLRYEDWQDLIDGYPELKTELYIQANKLKTS